MTIIYLHTAQSRAPGAVRRSALALCTTRHSGTHFQNTRMTTAWLSAAVNTPSFLKHNLHGRTRACHLWRTTKCLTGNHTALAYNQHTKLSSMPLP